MSRPATDVESRLQYVTGFASLANFIASDRDGTTLIFKRFNELAARNLLYLQSELAELHAQQQAFDREDVTADLNTKQCARNFKDFKEAAVNGGDQRQKERRKLMLQIRELLKEYREALMFESTLASMPLPSNTVLRTFRDQFHNRKNGKKAPYATLGGSSEHLYDDKDDLVALRVEDNPDRLTKIVQEHLAFMFPVSRGLWPLDGDYGLILSKRIGNARGLAWHMRRIVLLQPL